MTLQPFAIYSQRRAVDHRARRAARVPDPDDDRRAAVGHRHRRHGPARAAQRARHVGPGGRGGGRLLDAAARQDRHDHLRQPQAAEFLPVAGVDEQRAGRGRAARRAWPTRRPRAARSSTLAEERYGLAPREHARRRARAVHRADPHERRRLARARSIRKGAADSVRRWVRGAGRHGARRARRRSSTASPRAAARPLVVADGDRGARRDPPQGHREAGHARALRRAAGAWASAR